MNEIWSGILDFLGRIIMPDWSEVISWIPLMLVGLALLVLALAIPWMWWRHAGVNRNRLSLRRPAGVPPPGVHLPGPSMWPFVVPLGGALILFALALRPTDERGEPTAPVNLPLLLLGLTALVVAAAGWLRDANREWRAREGLTVSGEAVAVGHGAAVATLPADTSGVHASRALVPVGAAAAAGVATAGPEPFELEPPPGVHLPGPSPWPFFAPIGLAVVFFGLVLSPVILVAGLVMSAIAAFGWIRDATRELRQVETVGHVVPETRDPARAFPRRVVAAFAVVAVLALVVAAVPGLVGALQGGEGQPGGAPPGPEQPPSDEVAISADALLFDKDRLVVPADTPFTIDFDNQDNGVPHNVAIFRDPELSEALFTGEVITGPAQVTYEVEALPMGEYPFICSVHPNMKGTVAAS